MKEQITFTRRGLLMGLRMAVPIAISVFAYGVVFGVLARQAKLSLLESVLMSGLVFAGSSQFVALNMWVAPLPMLAIVITTFVVNLRMLLMGAALQPWLSRLPAGRSYTSVFFLADENWALTVREYNRGNRDAAFLLGSGLALFVAWVGSTITGQLLGSAVQDPAKWGLDFAFTAVFVALLTGMWRSKRDILPWLVAAVVALGTYFLLPGKWYILVGGLAGSLVGALRDGG